jgi:hypothetical protein
LSQNKPCGGGGSGGGGGGEPSLIHIHLLYTNDVALQDMGCTQFLDVKNLDKYGTFKMCL